MTSAIDRICDKCKTKITGISYGYDTVMLCGHCLYVNTPADLEYQRLVKAFTDHDSKPNPIISAKEAMPLPTTCNRAATANPDREAIAAKNMELLRWMAESNENICTHAGKDYRISNTLYVFMIDKWAISSCLTEFLRGDWLLYKKPKTRREIPWHEVYVKIKTYPKDWQKLLHNVVRVGADGTEHEVLAHQFDDNFHNARYYIEE